MAVTGLLALLDDIATVLDDVAVLTKVATKKTAGVLGDDLALNADQVSGVRAERELPVVWAVMKGSALNKAILVPAALLISAVAPWLITPLLMVGGSFLCFEGFEKVAHKLFHKKGEGEAEVAARRASLVDASVDLVALEKKKISGAIRTDFILSAEIVVIALGTAANAAFAQRAGMLVAISAVMTLGVYGLVAAIVKLDDAGVALEKRDGALAKNLGKLLLRGAPLLLRGLGVLGTVAMFLVGGGIVAHSVSALHLRIQAAGVALRGVPVLGALAPTLLEGLVGVLVGAVLVALVTVGKKLFGKKQASA